MVSASRQNFVFQVVERNIRTSDFLFNWSDISELSTSFGLGYLGITQGVPSAGVD